MSADLLKTIDLLTALKTRLAAIAHPTTVGDKLFETVVFHEDKNLAEAMAELIIVKKRICLIVPSGDRFDTEKVGRSLRHTRFTSFDLVMADQNYLKGGQDAAFGGPTNVGVITMKDIVVANLAAAPQLEGLRWCALFPTDAAFLTIAADEAKKLTGRQALVVSYETPSGEIITPLTSAWPAQS